MSASTGGSINPKGVVIKYDHATSLMGQSEHSGASEDFGRHPARETDAQRPPAPRLDIDECGRDKQHERENE